MAVVMAEGDHIRVKARHRPRCNAAASTRPHHRERRTAGFVGRPPAPGWVLCEGIHRGPDGRALASAHQHDGWLAARLLSRKEPRCDNVLAGRRRSPRTLCLGAGCGPRRQRRRRQSTATRPRLHGSPPRVSRYAGHGAARVPTPGSSTKRLQLLRLRQHRSVARTGSIPCRAAVLATARSALMATSRCGSTPRWTPAFRSTWTAVRGQSVTRSGAFGSSVGHGRVDER